jgi:hypothetical protein
MRTFESLAGICGFVVVLTAAAASSAADQVQLEGEVVDLACYLSRGEKGRGPDHQECAEMCAEGGQPLGLLVEGGDVLLLVEDHAKPAPYESAKELAGKDAKIGGQKVSRGGMNAIVVHEAKER